MPSLDSSGFAMVTSARLFLLNSVHSVDVLSVSHVCAQQETDFLGDTEMRENLKLHIDRALFASPRQDAGAGMGVRAGEGSGSGGMRVAGEGWGSKNEVRSGAAAG